MIVTWSVISRWWSQSLCLLLGCLHTQTRCMLQTALQDLGIDWLQDLRVHGTHTDLATSTQWYSETY